MINWLNQNQGAVMAGLTLAYVATTYVILRTTRSAVREQVALRQAQFRPSVLVDLELDGERMITFFAVENVGTMTARSVAFTISPRYENPSKPTLHLDIPLVTDGIDALVPGRKIRTMISVAGDFDPAGMRYSVGVSYSSDDGRRFEETYTLDFGVLKGVKPSTPKGLHSIATTLEKIESGLSRFAVVVPVDKPARTTPL